MFVILTLLLNEEWSFTKTAKNSSNFYKFFSQNTGGKNLKLLLSPGSATRHLVTVYKLYDAFYLIFSPPFLPN